MIFLYNLWEISCDFCAYQLTWTYTYNESQAKHILTADGYTLVIPLSDISHFSNPGAWLDHYFQQHRKEGDALLGDAEISPNKNLSPSSGNNPNNLLGDTEISPSKNKRAKGQGSGYIHWRLSQGKYAQAYYHYEIWRDGNCALYQRSHPAVKLLKQIAKNLKQLS
jgi:hypothetical protein